MAPVDAAQPLDDDDPFVKEARDDEADEKVSRARTKRGFLRGLLHRKRPHREHIGLEPRRDSDSASVVSSTFFWTEEEAAEKRQQGNVRAQIGSQLTRRMRSAVKANRHHGHLPRPHLHNSSKESLVEPTPASSEVSLPETVQRPELERQDSHLSLATQDTALAALAADDDDEATLDGDGGFGRINRSKTQRARRAVQKRFVQKLAYSQRADLTPEERDAALVEALATTHIGFGDNERLRETEVLFENQRGFVIFGKLKFLPDSHLPGDPPTWTQGDHRPSPYTKNAFPLPDPRWEWSTGWLIDMRLPCDEDGWSYSLRFSQNGWHAYPSWRNSFVRRRRWVRERRIAGNLSSAAAQHPDPPFHRDGPVEHTADPLLTSAADAHQAPRHVTAGPAPLNLDLLSPLPLEVALAVLDWGKHVETEWPFCSLSRVTRQGELELSSLGIEKPADWKQTCREAVMECSLRRLERTLGPCPLDRERMWFWETWLAGSGERPKAEMRDFWVVVETKIDVLLSMFEYQDARVRLLHALLKRLADEDDERAERIARQLHPGADGDEDDETGIAPRIRFADYLRSLLDLWSKKFSLAPELPFAPVPTPTLLAEAPKAKPPATPFFDAPTGSTPFFEVPNSLG